MADEVTYNSNTNNNTGSSGTTWSRSNPDESFTLFDSRLYRNLLIYEEGKYKIENTVYPHYDYDSYIADYYGTDEGSRQKAESSDSLNENERKTLTKQADEIKAFNEKEQNTALSARSFIHPYALVKLAGAYGNKDTVLKSLTYDRYDKRKFYEIDGEENYSGNYSKNPTTTLLVKWGKESARNTTPYSFQDFAFCKWWNKIENNRLITLRRYAMPVTDNIEFPDYDINDTGDSGDKFEISNEDGSGKVTISGSNSNSPYTPLATAVTYFGEDTGNSLSEILSFSVGYKWTSLNNGQKDPFTINSTQSNGGDDFMPHSGGVMSALSSGLGGIARAMAIFGDIKSDGKTINLEGAPGTAPPDPYSTGPYENRILGPINVITNTYRRDRGLEFKNDGLHITFEYVSRPIGGINNKAVLLDLLANMLVLTYSSGTWYGGMWRYRAASKPAVYPFKYGDAMNKLYKGQLFGKNGAVEGLTKEVFSDGGNALSTILPDTMSMIGNIFSGAVNAIKSLFTGGDKNNGGKEDKKDSMAKFNAAFETRTMKTIQKIIAAKALKGTTIPFIQNQRALLTGEPIGDWHLTIGNPLNPIAMIGNLIVKDMKVTFSDELGPDDFPIGFKAVVTLDHGLGRDRDAIESMFNRGFGRIYTLPSKFRSSADSETKVDKYTGNIHNTQEGRIKYEETRNTYYGGGTAFIAGIEHHDLANKGAIYDGKTMNIKSLSPSSAISTSQSVPDYYISPWMMSYTL